MIVNSVGKAQEKVEEPKTSEQSWWSMSCGRSRVVLYKVREPRSAGYEYYKERA